MTDSAQLSSSASTQRRSNVLSHIRSGFTAGQKPIKQPVSFTSQSPFAQTKVKQETVLPQPKKHDLALLDRVISEVEQQSLAATEPPQVLEPEPQVTQAPPTQGQVLPQAQPDVVPVTIAQAVPQAVSQATDTLNPTHPVAAGAAKEYLEVGATIDQSSKDTEQTAGAAPVETEISPEISPEVEAYLEKVEEQQSKIPEEIVLADDGQTLSTKPHIAQPVIILPITEQEEDEGAKKSPTFSFRWLVEWSRKLMKKFTGEVIYREE